MNKHLLPANVSIILFASFNATAGLPNGVASGDVSQNSAVLWSRSDNLGALTFEYSKQADFSSIEGTVAHTIGDTLVPAKTKISGLDANSQYYYRATDSTGAVASGMFKTFAETGSGHHGIRFGVSGDWRGELSPYAALSNVPSRQLDFFAVLGDTVYADYASPAVNKPQASSLTDFRLKHDEVYSARHGINSLGNLRASTSVFATIDDHEVTNDFSGFADVSSDARFSADPAGTPINDSTLYENGLQAFQEYNPIADEFYSNTGTDPRMDGERKLYRQRSMGDDALFISLDTRTFRDPGLTEVSNPLDPAQVGQYLATSLTADRTLLGQRQLADLKADVLDAHNNGVTWKFISVPEPAQNLGVVGASDRFEGYAKERTEILKFIEDNHIENVVFITADIHGTVVNNLAYQQVTATGIEQVPTSVFEISTGSVAFDSPFGPSVLDIAASIPAAPGVTLLDVFLSGLGLPSREAFDALPLAVKDQAIKALLDEQIVPLGYSPVGLEDSDINVTLLEGGYTALHTYGWTEFEIDADTQNLLVTTFGVEYYGEDDLANNLADILALEPQIISQFEVKPQVSAVPLPAAMWMFLSALAGITRLRKK